MSGSWSGGYLRELREAAGLSLQAVAERMREAEHASNGTGAAS